MLFKNIKLTGFVLVTLIALTLAACAPATATEDAQPAIPSVEVADQEIENDRVVISEVISDGSGWVVIHAQAEGSPGPVIGYAGLKDGVNEDVVVAIDTSAATPIMYAMLHKDAGTPGTYEFPGEDGPVAVDGQVVTPSFSVGNLMAKSTQEAIVQVANDPVLGDYLVDGAGMTLYLFTRDEPGVSNCAGPCLEAWPPLLVEGEPVAGEGVTGVLGTIALADGSMMVTYNDIPLYYYVEDQEPGDTTGQGVGDVWFVVAPVTTSFADVMEHTPTVKVANEPELGDFLVDSEGMTLYLFTRDEPGVSNCAGPCLEAWPPLLVGGEPVAGEGVTGTLGTIALADGSMMVTYNDMPLYYYVEDQEPGDTTGQGVGDVWFVVAPSLDEQSSRDSYYE